MPASKNGEFRYDFIKSPDCREVIVDGVYGSTGPRGRINVVLFTERNHIPASITHSIETNGSAGAEILAKRELKDGLVRVVETVLLLDLAAAKEMHSFLAARISELSKR